MSAAVVQIHSVNGLCSIYGLRAPSQFLKPRVRLSSCRANSIQSTSRRKQLLERTTPNPVIALYGDKPIYPNISLGHSHALQSSSTVQDLASTTPAKLETPEALKKEDYDGSIPIGDRAKYLFRLGKSYLAFYKTGLKNIWNNYKQLRVIKQRIGSRQLEDAVKYGGQTAENGTPAPIISRNEYQLYLRTRHDLWKLVPFSLVFAICGEFTPLVILAVGSAAVPYTCRIPKQEQKDFLRPVRVDEIYKAEQEKLNAPREPTSQPQASDLEWKQAFLEAHRLHVNPFARPLPGLGKAWHSLYVRSRLQQHCEEVLCDTILIRREGGFEKLSPREVFQWSFKYGLRLLKEHLDDLQREGAPVDPDSPQLKKMLLPVIEAEADWMLDVDWQRIKPADHWRAVFRPLGIVTPDDRKLLDR